MKLANTSKIGRARTATKSRTTDPQHEAGGAVTERHGFICQGKLIMIVLSEVRGQGNIWRGGFFFLFLFFFFCTNDITGRFFFLCPFCFAGWTSVSLGEGRR